MAKKGKYVYKGMSLPIVFIAITLACIGIVMVFSTSYNAALLSTQGKSYYSEVIMQIAVGIVGIICMFVMARLDYHILLDKRILTVGYFACVALLVAVFFFEPVRDSYRWIRLPFFTIQSSEFAKYMSIIYVSYYTSTRKWWYRNILDWIKLLVPIGVFAVLILLETDLSTTLCILGAVVVIMFVSGMQWSLLIGAFGVIGILIFVIAVTGYQGDRFDSWLRAWSDPRDNGYQVVQSLYAIGDGGLFGVGLGNSKQKITHLPMSDTDYIFSIICEEFGFLGALLVVGLYLAFAFFGIKVAMEAADTFGAYLATGITSIIVLQAFINMAVATNVIPSTGITLPFISNGATSLGIVLVATGLLLSVSARKRRKPKETKSNG